MAANRGDAMWTVWFVLECALGVVAAILVWMLIVAMIVTHIEERHHHGRHRPAGHGGGR